MSLEVRVAPDWLRLRERADATARSSVLAGLLRTTPDEEGVRVVHDLGCGDGAMGRWLAPLLGGRQHWVLHDLDPDLLALAVRSAPAGTTAEAHPEDVTRLPAGALAGASLVTASALLDLLTAEEVARLVDACVASGAPALLTLSVTGRVVLAPRDPLDRALRDAFNGHQSRRTARGVLLGPTAGAAAAARFRAAGHRVRPARSPWRLAGDPALTRAWLDGWVSAAIEHSPGLGPAAPAYLRRRLAQLDAGELVVTVDHLDLLATPDGGVP